MSHSIKMSGLSSLPVELLVHIFESATRLRDAAALSEADKRLHDIWNERNDQIVAAVLQCQIPAFEDALGLALAEASIEALPPSNPDTIDAILYITGKLPLRTHVRRLLENAQLADSATCVWSAWIAGLKPSNYRRRLKYGSPHASYYLIRKLVLSSRCRYARLRDELYSRLNECPEEDLNTHDELCTYLCGRCPDEERAKQGISRNKEDWSAIEELEQYANVEEWDHANEAVGATLRDRLHGTETLKSIIFKDM